MPSNQEEIQASPLELQNLLSFFLFFSLFLPFSLEHLVNIFVFSSLLGVPLAETKKGGWLVLQMSSHLLTKSRSINDFNYSSIIILY